MMIETALVHAFHVVIGALFAHTSGVTFGEGFLGIGGSSSGTDRKNTLAGYGDLGNIFNTGVAQGNQQLSQGNQNTGSAANFDNQILNGNRSSIMSALSPQISSITGQANQARKQQANLGTARGGGVNAGDQQMQQQEQGAISNVVGGAQPAAAKDLAQIGAGQTSAGGNLLGLGANAAGTLTGDSIDSYKTTSANNAALGSAAGTIASSLLFGM
jgi:hypothetical protein